MDNGVYTLIWEFNHSLGYGSSYLISDEKLSGYDIEVHEIPLKYEKPVLINGKNSFDKSGDFTSLDVHLVIAKYKGKYGVIDVRYPESPVIPFVYDKIEANYISFILHKKGLKCHYPISETPRYKELSPFVYREFFIRFTLPDGEKGWLLKNGEEFLDSEPVVVNDDDSIYLAQYVDEPPEFPGGADSLFKYTRESFVYPRMDESCDGNPVVQVVVNKDGTLSDVKMARSIHPLIDKEALRVVRSMPRWKPGRHKGRPVRVYFSIPIRLKLD